MCMDSTLGDDDVGANLVKDGMGGRDNVFLHGICGGVGVYMFTKTSTSCFNTVCCALPTMLRKVG